jgi:hypothetical protein
MSHDLGLVDYLRKAKVAVAHLRRRDPTAPRLVPRKGKVVTLRGNLAVVLPCEDGSAIGYAIVPSHKLVRLPNADVARFAAPPVYRDDPERRFQSAVSRLLSEFAAIERRAVALARATAGNGHAYPPVNGSAGVTGIHIPAE